jgi:hypothetical protein
MSMSKLYTVGPAFIAAAAADIDTPTAGIAKIVKHVRVVNKDASSRTFTLYKGATGGSASGTEIAEEKSIPANDYVDMYFSPGLRFSPTEYLSGVASVASQLVITVMGDQIVN